jgi:hypothetical protein
MTAYYLSGCNAAAAARRLGAADTPVLNRLRGLGAVVGNRGWSDKDHAELLRLCEAHVPVAEVLSFVDLIQTRGGFKVCTVCEAAKPLDAFRLKDFGRTRSQPCRPCFQEKVAVSLRRARLELMRMLCDGIIQCQWCSYDADVDALVFDHVNDDGHVDRKRRTHHAWAIMSLIREDPARFQVLCSNCNTIKAKRHLEEKVRQRRGR